MNVTMDIVVTEKAQEFLDRLEKINIGKLPKKSKWHSVKDEMPDNNRLLLLKTHLDGSIVPGCYLKEKQHWRVQPIFDTWYITESGVAHWRELPKPPE